MQHFDDIEKIQYAIAYNRDEEAYRSLFISMYKSAIHFASIITKNEEAAEELYADTMIKIWYMGDKLVEIKNLKTFIFVVLRNASLNHLKKEKKSSYISIDDIEINNIEEKSVDEFAYYQLEQLLENAVNTLPVKCLMVYKLIKNDGFSYKQTAEILSLSVNTIEGHMQNALQKIAAYLERAGMINKKR